MYYCQLNVICFEALSAFLVDWVILVPSENGKGRDSQSTKRPIACSGRRTRKAPAAFFIFEFLYTPKKVLEMDPSDIHTNHRLKREVLRFATRISALSPGTTVADNALMRGELDKQHKVEISWQNQVLNDHLLFLQEMLQEMLPVLPCD